MHKTRSGAALAAITVLYLLFAGCDSFSLLEQFRKTSAPELVLTVQKSSLKQGETIELYPSGGTPPYSFGVVEGDLYYQGTLGSIASQSYTAGTSIGTIEIHLTDATGESADATVTVIPPAPTNFTAVPSLSASKSIDLSWSYSNAAFISGFLIEDSQDGVTFTALPPVGSGTTTLTVSIPNQKQTFFKMYAAAGAYQSLMTPVISSQTS